MNVALLSEIIATQNDKSSLPNWDDVIHMVKTIFFFSNCFMYSVLSRMS